MVKLVKKNEIQVKKVWAFPRDKENGQYYRGACKPGFEYTS